MKYYLGIDPGISGGISLIDENKKIILTEIMPIFKSDKNKKELDVKEIVAILKRLQEDFGITQAGLESVHAFPGQGVSSMFKFGKVFGIIIGILQALDIPYSFIRPLRWQREVLVGYRGKYPKENAKAFISQLYPNYNFKASDRCKKQHDGLIDAVCIALYVLK